jgi:hypothetical protein
MPVFKLVVLAMRGHAWATFVEQLWSSFFIVLLRMPLDPSLNPVKQKHPTLQVALCTFCLKHQYDWSAEERAAALAAGTFNPESCVISGIKVHAGNIYVTVPRWRPGVPASLAKVGGWWLLEVAR